MTETVPSESMEFSVSLEPAEVPPRLYHGFWLRKLGFHDSHINGHRVLKRRYTAENDRLMLPDGEVGTAGIIRLSILDGGQPAGFGWIKLGFDRSCNPICFMTFPGLVDDDPDTRHLSAGAEELLAPTSGSKDWLRHRIFNNDWTYASNQTLSKLPPHSRDSRTGSDKVDDGFQFTFKAPLFEISVSATRVSDIRPTARSGGEVWAVDIVAGKEPVYYPNHGCCC